MYDREINGAEFSFGVSGKLIRNTLVMYDRQTESYWSQLLGEAVAGEMIGTKLTYLPSWMMKWADWKELHPDSVALDKFGQLGTDSYLNYYLSGQAGVIPETYEDDRLGSKQFVIGVELEDATAAYPFVTLSTEPVVNDTVGDTYLLVVLDVTSVGTAVYNRNVAGQILTFRAGDTLDTLTDAETGSTWDTFTGQAIDGPLTGTTLEQIKHTTAFWFGWKDWHPDTLVYGK